jgi:phosphopantetheinyl transferase (holo-ACP synthase)
MIVVGNDLINMSVPENLKTFSRKGINKFFSCNENVFVEELSSEYAYAHLWAMKESIYKCMMKFGSNKFLCQLKMINELKIVDNVWYGKVLGNDHNYFALCYLDNNSVKCVASNSLLALDVMQSFIITKSSVWVYDEIVAFLKQDFAIEELIKTRNNIPFIMSADKHKYLEISLSNEGNDYFVSYLPKLLDIVNCAYLKA